MKKKIYESGKWIERLVRECRMNRKEGEEVMKNKVNKSMISECIEK